MAREMTVTAILDANISRFLDGMNTAEGASSRLESNTTKAGGSMFKSFMGAQIGANLVTNAIGMISSGFADITSEMNDNAKAWNMFEGNLKMIGESDREIARVKASLQDFATATIYSASDMAQTYSQMAAIGYKESEKLVKGMGGIAASAENPAQAMKSLSTQMVQALSQPEMKWQDFRIMLEQAPAGMAQVAEEMGYSLQGLINAIQDGEVASTDFANAVATVGTNDHFSNLATTATTIDQAMDGLTETIANKLEPAFMIVSDIGINAINGIADAIGNLDFTPAINSLKRFGTWMGLLDDPFEGVAETIAMTTEELETLASGWDNLTLDEKQAQVNTMGQDDLEELMQLMGVDFDSIPDEYTKNAYLNAYGKDALEELLWVTGTWHDLTLEEKAAVLKQQIDNDKVLEVIEQRDLWNNAEFVSQVAEINWNDDDALQQLETLINTWGEAEGLEPITLEADAEPIKEAVKEVENIDWRETATNMVNGLGTALGDAVNNLADFATPILISVQERIDSLDWSTVGADVGTWVGDTIQNSLDNIKEFDYSRINELFTQLGITIEKSVNAVFYGSTGILKGLIASFGYEEEIADLEKLFSRLSNIEFTGDFNKLVNSIENAFRNAFRNWSWNDVFPSLEIGSLFSKNKVSFDWNQMFENAFSWSGTGKKAYVVVDSEVEFGEIDFNEERLDDFLRDLTDREPQEVIQEVKTEIDVLVDDNAGYDEMKQAIDGIFGEGAFDAIIEVHPEFILTGESGGGTSQGSGGFGIAGAIKELIPTDPIQADIPVNPNIQIREAGAGGSAGSASGAGGVFEGIVKSLTPTTPIDMNVPLAPSFDFTSAIADVNSQMVAIQSVVQSRMQSIQNTVTALMNGVNANFSSGMSQARSTVQSGMSAVVSALNSASSGAYSAGVNTGAGFARGLASQRGAVVSQAQAIANAASSAIQSALKIQSPSRVMESLGEYTGQGFIDGLANMMENVASTANQFAVNAIPNIPNTDMSYTSAINHSVQDTFANQTRVDDITRAIENQSIVIDMDGYRVGQLQRGYNNENLGTDARLTERWAF